MKKGIFISAVAALIISLNANAEATKEKREIGTFSQIEASKGVNISLVQCDDKHELEVVTEGCPTSDVDAFVKKDVLYVKMKKRTAGSAVEVFIYFKDVDAVTVKGGASLSTDCLFSHKGKFTLDVASQCEAEMEIEVDELEVFGNTCIITMNGTAKKQVVDISGMLGCCKYDAESLTTEETIINVSSSEAIVNATKTLDATAQGGSIKYTGGAEVIKKESFGGEIKEN